MEKKRINKLVVPLTIKSLSVLGAFTVMTSSLASCKSNKKTSGDNSSSIITSSSEDAVVDNNREEIEINSSSNDESVTAGVDSKPNSNTNNNQSKSNTPKPSTGNKNNTTNNNQQPNQNNNNNNNNNIQPSQGESSENPKQEMPNVLTAENINNVDVFKYFASKLNKESFPGVTFFNYGYYYEGNTYYTDGEKEMEFMLAMLNYKYLSSDTLTTLFNSESLDNIKRYSFFIVTMVDMARDKKLTYNLNQYSVDKNFGNYIAQNQKEYLKFISGSNNDYEKIAKQYVFGKGNYHYNQGNPFYDNFLLLSIRLSGVNLRDSELICQIDNVYSDISNNYNSLATDIYNYSHGKVKKISK
jgi:hypothetical protein